VHWLMLENGWTFADGPGVVPTMGLAWIFDHVVVVLPPPARADEYRGWLNENALVETTAKVRSPLSDRTRKPNVYVIDLPTPLPSSRIWTRRRFIILWLNSRLI